MDGKQVITYSKGNNTYFKRPETEGDMRALLSDGAYSILLGFSDPNAYQAPSSRALGPKQMNGASMIAVEATARHATTTYYLDPTDHVARTSTTDYKSTGGASASVIVHTTAMDLNASLPDSTFVFSPPDGSHELSLDEINAGKWFSNLDAACKAAAATHKKVFIDFMATWCGPCHMLDDQCFHTNTFKRFAKNYVFCRIDVDDQPALAQQYDANAIPLQVVADTSGGVIDKKIGYGGPDDFFAFLAKNAR
jgi:thiol-disulfide isomerase/thioredoxin